MRTGGNRRVDLRNSPCVHIHDGEQRVTAIIEGWTERNWDRLVIERSGEIRGTEQAHAHSPSIAESSIECQFSGHAYGKRGS